MFRRKAPPHPWALTSPLLDLAGVPWTVDDATMGTHIFGAVGSGKTSSSGNAIAQAFLLHQFGGLVLCAKADEAQRWRAYAEQAGRSQDVRVVQAGGPYRFNFLDHELAVGGSLVQLLTDTLELTEGRQSLDSNPFWARATAELVTKMDPAFFSALTVTVVPDTPLDRLARKGRFAVPPVPALLRELRTMVAEARPTSAVFRTNHASNYLPIGGRLPQDRARIVAVIDAALRCEIPLRHEHLRGL